MNSSAAAPATLFARIRSDPVLATWALFACLVLISYGLPLVWLITVLVQRGVDVFPLEDRDFANYWAAGKLIRSGEVSVLFDPVPYFSHLQQLLGEHTQPRNWSYPPHFLLLLWPLGFLGYRAAMVVFLLVTFELFALATAMVRREFAPSADWRALGLALFGYAVLMVAVAQNGFLTSALILFTLALMRRRPALAGFALALLTVKPQLGFLFPLLALMDRNWRLLSWAAVFSLCLWGVSAALFGMPSWQAYFATVVPAQFEVATQWTGSFLNMMPGVLGSLRSLGVPADVALKAQIAVSALCLPLVVWLWIRSRDPLDRAFVLTAGTLLISPYAFNYDMGALCVLACLMALRCDPRRSRAAAIVIALLCVLPALMGDLARMHAPILPLVLLAGLAALASMLRPVASQPAPAG